MQVFWDEVQEVQSLEMRYMMFRFFSLHFIYFEERVSLGWSQIFNLVSVSRVLQLQMCTTISSFFRWESLCRQGLESLCTPFLFSSLLSWLHSPKYNRLGRNTCSGPWPSNWAPQQMPSSSYVNESRQTPALWDSVLLCFSSRLVQVRDDQTPILEMTSLPQNITTSWYPREEIPRNPSTYRWHRCCTPGANQPGLSATLVQGEVVGCRREGGKGGLILVCTKESSSGQGFPARHPWGVCKVPRDARNAVQAAGMSLPKADTFLLFQQPSYFSLQQQKS